MKNRALNEIRRLITPLVIKPLVKVIYIFGSSVKKKGNDIDIAILVDDTTKGYNKEMQKLISRIKKIEKSNRLDLHFQPPLNLSLFWSLLIKGEPWAVTSLKDVIVLYDSSNYLKLIRKLIKRKFLVGKELKSERLVARSQELLNVNRSLRLMFIENLFYVANEAAQIFLISKGKIAFEPKKILNELKNYTSDTGVYFELLDLNSKASKGQLSEFTGENLDYYINKLEKFIKELESLIGGKNER